MGSKSYSTTTLTEVDKRLVTADSSLGVSADNSSVAVNVLDNGAISNAFAFADVQGARAIDLLKSADQAEAKNFGLLLGAADKLFDRSFGQVQSSGAAIERAYSGAKGEGTEKQLIMYTGYPVSSTYVNM